jgi:hypothetical protein
MARRMASRSVGHAATIQPAAVERFAITGDRETAAGDPLFRLPAADNPATMLALRRPDPQSMIFSYRGSAPAHSVDFEDSPLDGSFS